MTQEDIIAHIEAQKYGPLCNVDLPDVAIETAIDMVNKTLHMPSDFKDCIIPKMTAAQFLTMKTALIESWPHHILKTKDGTLQEYKDLLNKLGQKFVGTYSLLFLRFFTEEEILENMDLFDPEVFRKASVLYYSKDTLSKLNKFHGRRFRYNIGVTSLMRIVGTRTYNKMPITDEDFLYLAEKTNSTNEQMLSVLESKGVFMKKEYLKNLLPMIEFLKVKKQ